MSATSDSGCKAFCGVGYGNLIGAAKQEWRRHLAYPWDGVVYCSPVCRDRAIAPKAPKGVPAGYAECFRRCGRFAKKYSDGSVVVTCCHCFGKGATDRVEKLEAVYGPDWTPEAHPAPHPERRAPRVGETWLRRGDNRAPFVIDAIGKVDPDRCRCSDHVSWHENNGAGAQNGVCMIGFMDRSSVYEFVSAPAAKSPEASKPCDGRCMKNVGTMDRPSWVFCSPCSVNAERAIAAAKASKPETAKAKCCERCGTTSAVAIGQRALVDRLVVCCVPCWKRADTWNRRQSGVSVLRDDKVPARLPRTRLTCQAMWPDWDC